MSKLLPVQSYKQYTSHSLKCTLLTYTNVFGLTLDQNELLGYHVVKGHSSALNYSRDALATPIRSMMAMLEGVKNGTFNPLADREGHFASLEQATCVTRQFEDGLGMSVEQAIDLIANQDYIDDNVGAAHLEAKMRLVQAGKDVKLDVPCALQHMAEDDSSDDELETSSSDSGSTSAEEGMAEVERNVLGGRFHDINAHADVARMFRHVRTKMLHYAHVDDMYKTCCGRVVGESFAMFAKDPESAWPKCRVCFGR